jgi:two-component system nitrate/nitrite response regulator NarL
MLETVAVPCCAGRDTLGVIALLGPGPVELGDEAIEVLAHAGRCLGAFLARRRGELGLCPLSPRELQVLGMAGQGLSVRGIASDLTISPATVKTHLEHIYRKLGVRDKTAAVASALRAGYID